MRERERESSHIYYTALSPKQKIWIAVSTDVLPRRKRLKSEPQSEFYFPTSSH